MIIFTNSYETLHWILLLNICQSHLVIVFYLNDLIFLLASIPTHPPKSVVLLQIYQKLEGGALGTQWEYKGNTLGLHLSHMPCPNMWACIIYTWAKGKRIHINLFVMKASI